MAEDRQRSALTGIIVDDEPQLTLAELCQACGVHAEYIVELVEEGVLEPAGRDPRGWRFAGTHIRHATVAVRLQRDLQVNPAGIGLALQLLDEVQQLRARLHALEGRAGPP